MVTCGNVCCANELNKYVHVGGQSYLLRILFDSALSTSFLAGSALFLGVTSLTFLVGLGSTLGVRFFSGTFLTLEPGLVVLVLTFCLTVGVSVDNEAKMCRLM